MSKLRFLTLPVEAVEHGEAAATHFDRAGFRVKVEEKKLGFPATPAMICKRDHTTLIILVDTKLNKDLVLKWVAYCRSTQEDLRVGLCLPTSCHLSPLDLTVLQDGGVGLYFSDGSKVNENLPPRDLGLQLELPPLEDEPKRIRKLLGSAYEQFNRSQWREGFADAVQTLEVQAREYLKKGCRSGRIKFATGSGIPTSMSSSAIDRLTLGQLAAKFGEITPQNATDARIAGALRTLNKDRVGVSHHKKKSATERSLRRNVGVHMWVVLDALKAILGVPTA